MLYFFFIFCFLLYLVFDLFCTSVDVEICIDSLKYGFENGGFSTYGLFITAKTSYSNHMPPLNVFFIRTPLKYQILGMLDLLKRSRSIKKAGIWQPKQNRTQVTQKS